MNRYIGYNCITAALQVPDYPGLLRVISWVINGAFSQRSVHLFFE